MRSMANVVVLVPPELAGRVVDARLGELLGFAVCVAPLRTYPRVSVQACSESIGMRYRLSPRQRDVLVGVLVGDSNAEIAQKNDIAITTVKTHIETILERTQLRSRRRLSGLVFEPDSDPF